MPPDTCHRPDSVNTGVDPVQVPVRDMLEIKAYGGAQVIFEHHAGPEVGEPGQIEVLALRALDLVALGIQPAYAAAAREEQVPCAFPIPPLEDAGSGGPEEMVLGSLGDGLPEEAEAVSDDEV